MVEGIYITLLSLLSIINSIKALEEMYLDEFIFIDLFYITCVKIEKYKLTFFFLRNIIRFESIVSV